MRRKIIYIMIGLILLILSLNAQTRICYDLFVPTEYFILFPLLVIALVTSITLTIIDFLHKTKYKTIHLVILLSLASGLICGHFISQHQSSHTRKNFHQIISALRRYQIDNSNYPDNLDKLEPKYLPIIPSAYCGLTTLNFNYEIIKKNDTIIDCELSIYDRKTTTILTYFSEDNRIIYDDSFHH